MNAFKDYIIGADSVLNESEDLFSLIEAHEGKALKLYVYNLDNDACREVTIVANSKWGGEGALGCGIGYGYLHRIPIKTNLMEENSTSLQDAFKVPAGDIVQEPSTNTSPDASDDKTSAQITNPINSPQTQAPITSIQANPLQTAQPTGSPFVPISTGISSESSATPQPLPTYTQPQSFSPVIPASTPLAYTSPSIQPGQTSISPTTSLPSANLGSASSSLYPSTALAAASQYPSQQNFAPYTFSSPSYALTPTTAAAPAPAPVSPPYSVSQLNYQPILTPAFSPVAPPPATIVQTNVQPPTQTQLSDYHNANIISSYFDNSGKSEEFHQVINSGIENNFKA